MSDLIDRQAAIDVLLNIRQEEVVNGKRHHDYCSLSTAITVIKDLPSAQPELSDAYMKAVWTWLLNYQIRVAELKGRYTPYEVLSWVANDWRKEHE